MPILPKFFTDISTISFKYYFVLSAAALYQTHIIVIRHRMPVGPTRPLHHIINFTPTLHV